ncbi:glycosyltransferase [Winogradskyella sp. 3972H.M.0a.05]|uniref:glycosyltransferase family 2 protein n=1 Tax=Winogradskyella sp. 3972H.M.0a.05 TaxID=2950277 RepID=UPI003396FBA7
MKIYIIIPAHNEEDSIGLTLQSLCDQTVIPKQIVVVNDNSTDNTASIISSFVQKYPFISSINSTSSDEHLPGSKIINAFNKGLETLNDDYDIICKFDADLIFPNHYLEQLITHFNSNQKVGMAAGFCYIQKNDNWVLENLTKKDHIRGALKAYRKACFKDIGKLKASIGWDTLDELLAQYYGWSIITDESLHVKHLKPTGESYNKTAKYLQGEAMYKIRLGVILTFITALKMALKKKSFSTFTDYVVGYNKARKKKIPFLVDAKHGKFIRSLRWKGILNKFS